jgi:hypothetical protein
VIGDRVSIDLEVQLAAVPAEKAAWAHSVPFSRARRREA